jgi:predicted ATP-grasp superfamily ATP-dependent carboligase
MNGKTSEKYLVIIPDAEEDLTLGVLRCLGRHPLFATALISTSRVATIRSKYAQRHYVQPHTTAEHRIAFIEKITRTHRTNYSAFIILPVTLDGFRFVARYREILSSFVRIPPLPTLATINQASDKWKLHQIAVQHGIPVLPTQSLSAPALKAPSAIEFPFPYLIKARDRRGGFGFRIVNDQSELQSACQTLSSDENHQYIVQPLLDARDYSLSVFCRHGNITHHTLWKALHYGGRRFSIPRCVQFVDYDPVRQAGAVLMKANNWEGVADVDFIVDNHTQAVYLLEINARFWQTIPACLEAGVNFPGLMCETAAGVPTIAQPQKTGSIYARPSTLFDLMSRKWRHNRKIGLTNTVKTIIKLGGDPIPEFYRFLHRRLKVQ